MLTTGRLIMIQLTFRRNTYYGGKPFVSRSSNKRRSGIKKGNTDPAPWEPAKMSETPVNTIWSGRLVKVDLKANANFPVFCPNVSPNWIKWEPVEPGEKQSFQSSIQISTILAQTSGNGTLFITKISCWDDKAREVSEFLGVLNRFEPYTGNSAAAPQITTLTTNKAPCSVTRRLRGKRQQVLSNETKVR